MTTNASNLAVGTGGTRDGSHSAAHYAPIAARLVMGLVFFVFGLNAFLSFIPQPKTPMPALAMAFMVGLMKSGYMLKLIGGVEAIVGVLLLANRFVPLALAVIAPVIVNMVAFHLFLSPSGLPIASVVAALELYLAWTYRAAYRPMLAAR